MDYVEFIDKYNIHLNAQQDAAVQRTNGATLLLAVPGSGKTTVLVTRLGYMLYCKEIPPASILTMTYTVAATQDMRKRFAAIFGDEHAGNMEFRTINSVCAMIINRYVRQKNSLAFKLLDNNAPLLIEICKRQFSEYPTDGEIKNLQQAITYVKNMQLSREEIDAFEVDGRGIAPVYDAYMGEMKRRSLMDFDDQLVYAHTILKRPQILDYFQSKYRYLCVDEAQDTSKIQHNIIRLLSQKCNNLFMVGDEDQSIYGFRAAYPDALMSFEADYDHASVMLLEQNYRSTKEIVAASDRFIMRNLMRHEKHMKTDREPGKPVQKVELNNRRAQYSYIAKIVDNSPAGKTAILYRNNDSAVPVIDYLERKGIDFRCRQAENIFFTNRIVRDVTDILHLAFSPNDEDAFMRVYYKFSYPISKSAAHEAVQIKRLRQMDSFFEALTASRELPEWCRDKILELDAQFKTLKTDSAKVAVDRIRYKMGYGAYVLEHGADTEKLYILSVLAANEEGVDGFLKRLNALKHIVEAGPGDSSSKLVLSTIHASKGLEYERVILIDAIEGILPSITIPTSGTLDDEQRKTLEEERRLFYVAATRAKDDLILMSYGDQAGKCQFVTQFCQKTQPSHSPSKPIQKSQTNIPRIKPAATMNATIQWIEKDYIPGARVLHNPFGSGTVTNKHNGIVTIQLDNGQTKRFDLINCLKMGFMEITK